MTTDAGLVNYDPDVLNHPLVALGLIAAGAVVLGVAAIAALGGWAIGRIRTGVARY